MGLPHIVTSIKTAFHRAPLAYSTVFVCLAIAYFVTRLPEVTWQTGLTKNYLSIHIVMEFVGILVSFGVFTVGRATYRNVNALSILILSSASFAVGWLDLGHTLVFTGMPDFLGFHSGPNKTIEFWLASRYTGAISFLAAALVADKQLAKARLHFWATFTLFLSFAWTSLCFYMIWGVFKSHRYMFVPGIGVTELKVDLERIVLLISLTAGFAFARQKNDDQKLSAHWMACAMFIFAISSFFFTIYREFDDIFVLTGHLFKALGYIFVYRAVFLVCVSTPYEKMSHLAIEAEQASQSKSRFLANVSHEFRTPLGVIAGFSDLLVRSPDLTDEAKHWSEMIGRNSVQLRLLIDDLLDLTKAETGNISLSINYFDLRLVLRDVVAEFQLQASQKSIDLSISTALKEAVIVKTDEHRLRQILVNIIGNAVKFTSRGKIGIAVEWGEGIPVKILITDTGIGLEPHQIDQLFKPFAQADNPMSRRFGGTGLGLSLSRKLARLLGGDLLLESSVIHEGSTFSIFLPPAERSVQLASSRRAPKQILPPSFSHISSLAADDSPDNQELLQYYLSATNASLSFASNGQEAVQLAEQKQFDVVLMDIQMPLMDGFEATSTLRAKGWSGLILALSAHAHGPERERALAQGFDGYLVKPITMEQLWTALSDHLDRSYELN